MVTSDKEKKKTGHPDNDDGQKSKITTDRANLHKSFLHVARTCVLVAVLINQDPLRNYHDILLERLQACCLLPLRVVSETQPSAGKQQPNGAHSGTKTYSDTSDTNRAIIVLRKACMLMHTRPIKETPKHSNCTSMHSRDTPCNRRGQFHRNSIAHL